MYCSVTVFITVFCVLVSCEPVSRDWNQFLKYVNEYKKPYRNESALMLQKYEAFKQSLLRHQQLNFLEAQYGGTAVYGINKFSDLTPEEFKNTYLSKPRWQSPQTVTTKTSINSTLLSSYPKKFDWRDKHFVTSINNQKACGSCWAFSVVETLESALMIKNNRSSSTKFSVQQLISCDYDSNKGLEGCRGGEIIKAFETIVNSTTIVEAKEYPFSSGDGNTGNCKKDLPDKGILLKDYTYGFKIDEHKMLQYVHDYSPTSNAVNALMWQDYNSGIIQHHCSHSPLDHAIQVVGYSMEDPVPYWIVRNTWGSDWGEKGYLRLKFGDNTCGLAEEAIAVKEVATINL